MEEYRTYKEATGKHFLELLESPADVAEVTMQPLRRYDVDAAILFSDILVVPQALGIRVEMPGGKGIVVPDPVTDGAGAERLAKLAFEDPVALVRAKLNHVIGAVEAIREKQAEEGRDVTLLGFSAAPWTLLYYTVGASSKNPEPAADFVKKYPEATDALLDAYAVLVEEYVAAQLDAGAHAIQIFEAMSMALDDGEFEKLAMPRLRRLAKNLKVRHPEAPLLVFARGAVNPLRVNPALAAAGYDVVTIDTVADRAKTRDACGAATCLQGNLDPDCLRADTSSKARVEAEVEAMLAGFGGPGKLIANLGEGLMGNEDQDLVAHFVDTVHDLSKAKLKKAAH